MYEPRCFTLMVFAAASNLPYVLYYAYLKYVTYPYDVLFLPLSLQNLCSRMPLPMFVVPSVKYCKNGQAGKNKPSGQNVDLKAHFSKTFEDSSSYSAVMTEW